MVCKDRVGEVVFFFSRQYGQVREPAPERRSFPAPAGVTAGLTGSYGPFLLQQQQSRIHFRETK